MKTIEGISKKLQRIKSYFSVVIMFTALTIIISCSKDDPTPVVPDVVPPTSVACKVQTQSVAGTGRESATITYTYDFVFTYTYDEKDNQIGLNSSYKYKYSDGKTQISSVSSSNQYNENYFLLRTIYQYNATGKDGTTSNSNTNTDYVYTEGRLTKTTYNVNDNGKVSNYNFSYEYDVDGKLTKVSNTYDNSYTTFQWSGNKVQKMTRVDKVGNTNSPFLEYNSDGRLAKSIETRGGLSDEFRYQYDAKGQQIRYERYINAKPSSAFSSEYDNKVNPNLQLYPQHKGHPVIPGTQAEYIYKNNITKSMYYSGDPVTGEWKVESSTLYTHDYNGKNLPVESVAQNLDKNGVQTSTSRTSYQYLDCQ